MEDSALKNIRQVALKWLTCRDYTCFQLTEKLQDKGYEAAIITTLIAQLVTENLLNDERFTENYIHYRKTKGYGPKQISHALTARGIAAPMIAEYLNITDNAWFTEMRKIWQKRFKGVKPTDVKDKAKQMRFLYYRGYTQKQVNTLFHGQHYDEE